MTVYYEQREVPDPHLTLRDRLARDVAAFTRSGGTISVVPQGATGLAASGSSRRTGLHAMQLASNAANFRPKRTPKPKAKPEPKPKLRKKCVMCGKEWETWHVTAWCCSRQCNDRYQRGKARERREAAKRGGDWGAGTAARSAALTR